MPLNLDTRHIATSKLICIGSQLTVVYMIQPFNKQVFRKKT